MVKIHLEPGETFYVGYHEWLVHPLEARVILAQGFVTVNGERCPAHQVGEVQGFPQVRVTGLPGDQSDPQALGLAPRLRLAA